MFNAPIPGESLTKPPKNFPWERPPEYTDPEDVIQLYLTKLTEPERMGGIMDALEVGMSIRNVVEGVLRVGVSEGIHSIDVSLLAAPVLHDYIKGFADELGVEYDEGFEDKAQKEKDQKNVRFLKTKVRLEKYMQKNKGQKASTETEKSYEDAGPLEDEAAPVDPLAEPPVAPPEASGALIPRRSK
jgi:hypothetical protein